MELRAPTLSCVTKSACWQESVDALFDNGRRGALSPARTSPVEIAVRHAERQAGPLPSEPARQACRHSGRSVIVVGPELKLHQCGLPKKMALELFKPFILPKLEPTAWHRPLGGQAPWSKGTSRSVDILEEVIRETSRTSQPRADAASSWHPGFRAGVDRRQGDPCCIARLQQRLNADFDGDQMAFTCRYRSKLSWKRAC